MAKVKGKRLLSALLTAVMILGCITIPASALTEEGSAPEAPSIVEVTPETTPEEGEPAGTPEEGEPAGTPEEGEPADTPEEGEPADTPEEGEPADTPEEGEPADTPEEGESAGTPEEGEPAGTPEDGESADDPEAEESSVFEVERAVTVGPNTLVLTAPSDVKVELYDTINYNRFDNEHRVNPTSVTTENGITSYVFADLPVGSYNYLSSGNGYYTVDKNIWFSEAKAATGVTIDAYPGKLAGGGFEQNPNASPGFNVVRLQSDELWEKVFGKTWSDADDDILTSAYFTNRDRTTRDGVHQQTTNKEMVEWIQHLLAEENPKNYMHLFWYTKENVAPGHDLYADYEGAPILVFTKSDLSSARTLEDAAAVLARDTSKVTVQYQAQVHPPEPAATEGALVMARQLANSFGDEVLNNVNVVMIPRFNSDGSYEWIRVNTESGLDMNRDFHWLSCPETRMVVNIFNLFYPEVVIDTHEMQNDGAATWENQDDLQMTGNGSGGLNPQPLADLAIEELKFALNNAKQYGIRGTAYQQYPFDVYTTIGAAYPATRGSIGHLIETKGIHAGMSMFERRVMSQWAASSGIIRFASQNSARILSTVAQARQEIISKGATYEEDDVIILRHSDVTDRDPWWEDYDVYDWVSGEKTGTTDYTWIRRSGIVSSRPRPTAYVIPADIDGIDDILRVVEGHNIQYYKLDNGSSVKLNQYIYNNITSSVLSGEQTVTFANGAYVFPMNQTASTLMGLMFEPDVYDNRSYKSDFIRMGYMEAAEGQPLPLYRYEHNLVNGKVEAFTAATSGTMTLTAPADVEVVLYDTFDYRNFNEEHQVAPTSTATSNGITTYVFNNLPVGNYNYVSSGSGYYTVDKNIWFSAEKAANGLTVDANPGKMAGNGFEQDPNASEGFSVVRLQTDEVWEKVFGKTWSDADDDILTSPYFANRNQNTRNGVHQQTTNKEMVEWIKKLEQEQNPNGYMHLFWYTKEDVSPDHHLYDDYPGAPVLVFTKSNLSGANTLEDAAAILARNTNKVTVQYQAQVHPPEPAATEGALVMARQLAGEYGKKVLDNVDVVMIPRFNSDGSYEWVRVNTQNRDMDMNRDYHILSCPETRMIVNTFNLFYPEVVIDTHELQNQARGSDAADDLQMTGNGGGGLNPQALADLAIEELEYALNNAKEKYGIRGTAYQQYPYDVYTTIGAAYPATRGSIGHLIETKGIHAGMSMFERRVMSQWGAASGIISFAAENSGRILKTVAEARAEIVAKGATFETNDVIILRHHDVKDEEVFWEDYPVYDMASGVQTGTTDYTWIRRAGVDTSRPRPTAYVIPADISGIDDILKTVDGHQIQYYKLDNGSSVSLKQYVYQDITSSNLGGERTVTFANGAYVFPMNQTASTLMGLMFEPDVYDNRAYKSDFIRMGYMEATAGQPLPLYRYEHDLVNGKVSLTDPSSGSSSGSSSGGSSSSSGSSGYSISAPARVTGGTVKVRPSSANQGVKVTITATPNAGYELDRLTVTTSKGETIAVSSIGNNQYTFTMPASRVTVDAVFVRADTPTTPSTGMNFVDVPANAYYYNAVNWALANGVTAGTGANTFGPDSQCTRAQIMTFLWRAAGSPTVTGANPFTDVASNAYYAQAVQWAVAQGITSGTSETTFSPDGTCTRAQAVALIYRAKGSPQVSGTNSFTDVDAGAYYADAVQWAVSNGVTSGTSATTFGPDSQCTRAQIVTFLY